MTTWSAALLATLILAAGCDGGGSSEAADAAARCGEVFGSAAGAPTDVPIVASATPSWGDEEAPRVNPTPLLSIGGSVGDANYEFGQIGAATRLSDGRVVVGDAQIATLLVYDASGAFVQRIGRQGQGPGEFRTITNVFRTAEDTLWVDDMYGRRITALDASLGVAGTYPLTPIRFAAPPGERGGGSMAVQVRGRLADGHLIAIHRAGGFEMVTDPVTRVLRDTMIVRRVDPATGSGDSIGVILGGERFDFVGRDRSITFGPTLAGPVEAIAVASDRWYTGSGERFEIEERAGDGRVVRLLRVCDRPDSIPAARVEELIQSRLFGYDEETLRYEEPPMRELPTPTVAPAYVQLLVDGYDRLWAREFTYPSEQRRWKVFDREGRLLGQVETPADVTVLEIGTDYVLGHTTDALGVQSIRLLALD